MLQCFYPFTKQQNFTFVQIESVCFEKGRKLCGKRRKCWLPAFSPFPTIFLKGLYLEVIKSREWVLALYQTTKFWTVSNWKNLQTTKIRNCFGKGRKHFGERKNCWLPAFSPFPKMFSKAFFFRVVKSWDCVVKRGLSQTNPCFNVSVVQVFKKHWEKDVTSNLSFSHSVFYLFGELSAIFIKSDVVVCKPFQFGRV